MLEELVDSIMLTVEDRLKDRLSTELIYREDYLHPETKTFEGAIDIAIDYIITAYFLAEEAY